MSLRSELRHAALGAARLSGAQRLLRRTSEGPVVVFYHGIEEQIADPDVQGLHVPLRVFERQMRHVLHHREVISIEYLDECLRTGSGLHSRQVVITFDDGYRNNLTVAAPLLRGLNLPFTVFVSTRHITEGLRFPTYYLRTAIWHTRQSSIRLRCLGRSFPVESHVGREAALRDICRTMKTAPRALHDRIVEELREQLSRSQWEELDASFDSEAPMNWADVMLIRSMGATIGAHGHDHLILHAEQPLDEIRRQLRQSKLAVEAHAGRCEFMTYPNGNIPDISPAAYLEARSAGYRMGFTAIEGEVALDSDSYLAPRLFAPDDFEEFCYCLNRSGDQNTQYRAACRSFRMREFPATADTTAHEGRKRDG